MDWDHDSEMVSSMPGPWMSSVLLNLSFQQHVQHGSIVQIKMITIIAQTIHLACIRLGRDSASDSGGNKPEWCGTHKWGRCGRID